METYLDSWIQDKKRIADPTKELVDIMVDDEEPTRILRVGKNLKQGRFD